MAEMQIFVSNKNKPFFKKKDALWQKWNITLQMFLGKVT